MGGRSAGGKRKSTPRIASLRTRVADSGWVPEGSLARFFARHEPALALICGADRALTSPRDHTPLRHQSCHEPWGIMAQKPQLETSSATCLGNRGQKTRRCPRERTRTLRTKTHKWFSHSTCQMSGSVATPLMN